MVARRVGSRVIGCDGVSILCSERGKAGRLPSLSEEAAVFYRDELRRIVGGREHNL